MDAACTIQDSIHVFSLVRKYVSRILGTYHMVEPGTGASQYPHQMGKERPGKRAVYVGLFRYQRPFDESRLHWGDCFPEKGLPFQNRHDWGKEAGGLDCSGRTA